MKQKIIFFLCVVAMMVSMSSCNKSKGGSENTDESEKKLPNYIENISQQDSVTFKFANQVNTHRDELDKLKSKTAKLETKIEAQEKKQMTVWDWLSIGSCILSVVAILLYLLFGSQCADKDELKKLKESMKKSLKVEVDKIWLEIQNLKYQQQGSTQRNSYAPNQFDEIDALRRRIKALEDKLAEEITPSPKPHQDSNYPKTNNASRTIYAKSNSLKYFTEILPSNQEGCIYKITLKNENEGEFEIISLQKMKQSNSWREIVETTGKCLIDEAREFIVKEPGVCTKVDNSTWEIRKPLKIEIL